MLILLPLDKHGYREAQNIRGHKILQNCHPKPKLPQSDAPLEIRGWVCTLHGVKKQKMERFIIYFIGHSDLLSFNFQFCLNYHLFCIFSPCNNYKNYLHSKSHAKCFPNVTGWSPVMLEKVVLNQHI